MKIESRPLSNWLVSSAIILGLLIVGRSLLVPLVFAILLWSVLNSLIDTLKRLGLPEWLAWSSSIIAIVAVLYLVARILGSEAAALMTQGPVYLAKGEALISKWLAILHLSPASNVSDLFSRSDVAKLLAGTASSAGDLVFKLVLVVIYVCFLLSEQRSFPAKIAVMVEDEISREKGRQVIHQVTSQIQAYLGVCMLLSAVMAAITYIVLRNLGIDFAG